MTKVIVRKGKEPSPVDPAVMAQVGREIGLLLTALTDPKGSRLDAGQVAQALEALRNGRVEFTLPQEPKVVLTPWDDWSDLHQVPLSALGLRQKVYARVKGLKTVGVLLLHPLGKRRAGRLTGFTGQHAQNLRDCVAARGLTFAEDCSGLPLRLIAKERGGFLGWEDATWSFVEAHNLVTLGDLAAMSSERIASQPLPSREAVAPHNDLTREELIDRMVSDINLVLKYYGLPAIS